VKIDNFFSELTRIFHSPSQIRPKDSYFLGNSWVSPAPSTDLTDRSKRIVESFQNTQELIRFEGAARIGRATRNIRAETAQRLQGGGCSCSRHVGRNPSRIDPAAGLRCAAMGDEGGSFSSCSRVPGNTDFLGHLKFRVRRSVKKTEHVTSSPSDRAKE
jgi:hypothetical protein